MSKAGVGSREGVPDKSHSPCQAKQGARKWSGDGREPSASVRVTRENVGEPRLTGGSPRKEGLGQGLRV